MELKTISLDLIDPHPSNPRDDMGDLASLAASIAELGVLQAPAVTSNGGTRYTSEFGHRRIAASRLAGLTEIDVYVFDEHTPEDAYLALIAENDQQKPLTDAERDKGQQGLLAFGDLERAARATGVSATTLAAAKRGRTIIDKSKLMQASLDELAVIAEFEDDPETLLRLEGYIGSGNFKWAAQNARDGIERRAKDLALVEKLKALGATICPSANRSSHLMLDDIDTEDPDNKKLTIEYAADKCGLLYSIAPDGRVTIWIDRAEAAANKWYYRYGGHETVEERDAREARAAASEAEKLLAATSQTLRRDFLRDLVKLAIPTAIAKFVATMIREAGSWDYQLEGDTAKSILGDEDTNNSVLYVWATLVGLADQSIVADLEQPDNDESTATMLTWFDVLAKAGYTPTPWESVQLANARAALAPTSDAADGRCDDCDGDECADGCSADEPRDSASDECEHGEPLMEEAPAHIAAAISHTAPSMDGYLYIVEVANLISRAKGGMDAHTNPEEGAPRFDLVVHPDKTMLTVTGATSADDPTLISTIVAIADEADVEFGPAESVGALLVYTGVAL